MRIRYLIMVGLIVFVATGCVSQSKYDSDVRGLKTHISTLTNQVARLDVVLEDSQVALTEEMRTNASLVAELDKVNQPRAVVVTPQKSSSIRGTYRTPSGFELSGKKIQKALRNAGYYVGPVDGKIGPGSRQAIRDFQRDHDLTVDGICGRRTWQKLKPFLSVLK